MTCISSAGLTPKRCYSCSNQTLFCESYGTFHIHVESRYHCTIWVFPATCHAKERRYHARLSPLPASLDPRALQGENEKRAYDFSTQTLHHARLSTANHTARAIVRSSKVQKRSDHGFLAKANGPEPNTLQQPRVRNRGSSAHMSECILSLSFACVYDAWCKTPLLTT